MKFLKKMLRSRIFLMFFLVSLFLLSRCVSFPYQGFIAENARLYQLNYPDTFHTLKTEERTLSYVYQENKAAASLVVFVHGSPGSWSSFAHLMKNTSLLEKYALLAVDRPGYGYWDRGEVERDLKKQSSLVAEIVKKHANQKKVFLVGHSYGGALIAQMAVDFPDLCQGLVFVAASVDPDLEETKWIQYPADWTVVRWFIPSALEVCNQEILSLKNHLEGLKPALKAISQKSIIVHGEEDDLVPVQNVLYLEQALKGVLIQTDIIPHMNHFIPWAYPERILQAIERLVEETS